MNHTYSDECRASLEKCSEIPCRFHQLALNAVIARTHQQAKWSWQRNSKRYKHEENSGGACRSTSHSRERRWREITGSRQRLGRSQFPQIMSTPKQQVEIEVSTPLGAMVLRSVPWMVTRRAGRRRLFVSHVTLNP